jgi:hypothetical protein
LKYVLYNESLLENIDEPIFNTLKNDDMYKNFGNNKIIITTANIGDEEFPQEFTFHHNVLVNNNTTSEDYFNKIVWIILKRYKNDEYKSSSEISVIPCFKCKSLKYG